MSLPDFLCIGAHKAGTTWLYEMLAQNPSIWMPPIKEVHFFDRMGANDEARDRRRLHIEQLAQRAEKSGGKGSAADNQAEFLRSLTGEDLQTEAWYRRIFAHPDRVGRISGEITPFYLQLPEERVAYVKSLLPAAKILLIIREPKSRNVSQVKMAVARSKIGNPSDDDWNGFLKKLEGRQRGNYANDIPTWQKYFSPEQFLILPFSLVKTDPAGLLATIEKFIGAAPFSGYKSLDETVHKTKEVDVPGWVVERAGALAEPQKQYLIEAFGAEFYEKTK